jgi:hypothetical protein
MELELKTPAEIHSDCCVGLCWNDGVTLNGDESEFYIG